MKLIHWALCGSAALLGCVLLPASPARRAVAQAPPPAPAPAAPAQPAAAPAQPAAAPAEEKPAPLVLQMYDVGDLVLKAPDRPLGLGVLPPTQLNGGNSGRGLSYSSYGSGNGRQADTTEQNLTNLVALIQEEVAPDTWRETGGVASIRPIERLLAVRATAENQRQIAELLEMFRKSREAARVVTIHADWLWLNPGGLAQIVRPGKAGAAGREVDPAALQKLGPGSLYARGQITCAGGQTVHLLSGRVKTLVESLDAAVGTGSAAYQPEVGEILEGAALQVTPHLRGDSAVVDLLGFVSGWGERGEPYRFSQHTGPVAPDRPADPLALADNDSFATLDRLNVLAQEFCTTAHLPLGRPVIVGGMTLEPEGSGGGGAGGVAARASGAKPDAGAGRVPADDRQLYLVLRVEAE